MPSLVQYWFLKPHLARFVVEEISILDLLEELLSKVVFDD